MTKRSMLTGTSATSKPAPALRGGASEILLRCDRPEWAAGPTAEDRSRVLPGCSRRKPAPIPTKRKNRCRYPAAGLRPRPILPCRSPGQPRLTFAECFRFLTHYSSNRKSPHALWLSHFVLSRVTAQAWSRFDRRSHAQNHAPARLPLQCRQVCLLPAGSW